MYLQLPTTDGSSVCLKKMGAYEACMSIDHGEIEGSTNDAQIEDGLGGPTLAMETDQWDLETGSESTL